MPLPAYRVAQTISGNSPITKVFEAGGTITANTFVILGAAGTVTTIADDAAAITGLALNAATSGQAVTVVLAHPDVIFSGNVSTGAPYALSDMGSAFAVDVAGIDLDDATGGVSAIIHGLDATDSTATAGTRVLFSVKNLAYQGGPGGTAV